MTPNLIVDLFAGPRPGGWEEGARRAGYDGDIVGIEKDDDACATAEAAGHRRIQADVATYPLEEFAGLDGLIGSPPCFPAGAPVVTSSGVIPIESIRVGDLVLTHRGRWRAVTQTMSRTAKVCSDRWLRSTADHPFWTRTQIRQWDNDIRQYRWHLAEPEWTPASEIHEKFVALPELVDPLPVPPIAGRHVELDASFWYVVGRWLGDGWVRLVEADPEPAAARTGFSRIPCDCAHCGRPTSKHGRYSHLWNIYCTKACSFTASRARRTLPRADILICCADEEADGLASKLADTGLVWTRSQERTTSRFTASHVGLTRWLVDNFGRYAHGKTLPGWALGLPEEDRAAILAGYLDADGSAAANGWQACTVSEQLAVAMRLLATTLGYTTSLTVAKTARANATIEGRDVTERPLWTLRIAGDDGRYTRREFGHRWMKRRKPMTPDGEDVVYDITVDEDHSFVAWGFVVHNCTTFSKAGRKAGLADPRGELVWQPARWAIALRPRWVALEQVEEVLPIWQIVAAQLREHGYSAWTGKLVAADYGVPQTRTRAVLIARLDGTARPPAPTHAQLDGDDLFGSQLKPWITMADALGWTEEVAYRRTRGAGMVERHGDRPDTPASRPAPTITGKSRSDVWVLTRPATTVLGDPRIGRPGHKAWDKGEAQFQNGSVPVSVEEAAVLQSFRRDYPWQGSKSSQHQQCGNAIPVLLAAAILRPLLATVGQAAA